MTGLIRSWDDDTVYLILSLMLLNAHGRVHQEDQRIVSGSCNDLQKVDWFRYLVRAQTCCIKLARYVMSGD